MNQQTEDQKRWAEYYKRVAAKPRPPRELFFRTVKRFASEGLENGFAVDLGCGLGTETMELLRHGWRVLSVDAQQAAIDHINNELPDEYRDRWQTFVGSFETLDFPDCDFIWAGNCLPFCPKEHLDTVLNNITNALKPGGRFAADFFAPRHVWADDEKVTAFTKDALIATFPTLNVEYWLEGEGDILNGFDEQVYWHAHTVVFRKP